MIKIKAAIGKLASGAKAPVSQGKPSEPLMVAERTDLDYDSYAMEAEEAEYPYDEDEYAYEEDSYVLQDTISRLQRKVDQMESEYALLSTEKSLVESTLDAVTKENSLLREEISRINSSIASSVALEVSHATSSLVEKVDSLTQTVKAHSEHLVNAKIVDRRALSKDDNVDIYSVDPKDLYPTSSKSYAAVSTRVPPAPAPKLAPAPKRQKTTAEDYMAMSQKEKDGYFASSRPEKPLEQAFLIVHIEGFFFPKNSPIDIFSAVIEGEYGFSAKNFKYVSPVTSRIVECTIFADSLPALERALGSPKCRLTLLDESFDVSIPLSSADTVPNALGNFKKRLNKLISRLGDSYNPLMRRISTLFAKYRDHGDRSWTPPPRPTTTYCLADYVKRPKDVEMSSSDNSSKQ